MPLQVIASGSKVVLQSSFDGGIARASPCPLSVFIPVFWCTPPLSVNTMSFASCTPAAYARSANVGPSLHCTLVGAPAASAERSDKHFCCFHGREHSTSLPPSWQRLWPSAAKIAVAIFLSAFCWSIRQCALGALAPLSTFRQSL